MLQLGLLGTRGWGACSGPYVCARACARAWLLTDGWGCLSRHCGGSRNTERYKIEKHHTKGNSLRHIDYTRHFCLAHQATVHFTRRMADSKRLA